MSKIELTGAGDPKTVRQYQFPVKFQPLALDINGETVEGAATSGKGKSYTYFKLNGVSYYVEGHLDAAGTYNVAFPEGYVAKELKPQRVVSNKPKKVKEPKAEAATEGDAPSAEPAWKPAPGRRAKRSEAAAE